MGGEQVAIVLGCVLRAAVGMMPVARRRLRRSIVDFRAAIVSLASIERLIVYPAMRRD
jgi:hypothetical protein